LADTRPGDLRGTLLKSGWRTLAAFHKGTTVCHSGKCVSQYEEKDKNSKENSADIYCLLNPFVNAKVFMSSGEELINSVRK
jgi:hypothetical protein